MQSDILSLESIKRSFAPVLAAGGAKRAIVFGSYARGEADEYSDVDLVIIKETDLPFLDRYTDFQQLFQVTRKALQILVYTPDEFDSMRDRENPFILNVIEDGIVIYEARP
jgi:predicted nucleotidyltransferase